MTTGKKYYGQFYMNSKNDDVYILAMTGDKLITAICLNDGKRWNDPVKVSDHDNITDDEMKEIFKNGYSKMKQVAAHYALDLLASDSNFQNNTGRF